MPDDRPPDARPARTFRRALAVLALVAPMLALGGAGAAWWAGLWQPPERHDPWAPLNVELAPNWLTGWKLRRAQQDPALCAQRVAHLVSTLGWQAEPLPDRTTGPGCGFDGAWRLDRSSLALGAPVSLACPAVLSLAMWERHTLRAAALRHFDAPVTRLQHYGSYACRNVNHAPDTAPGSRRSQHATAQALDVAGFVLAGGRRITVARDWGAAPSQDAAGPGASSPVGGASASARFLREVRDGACRWFDGTLSPDYNAAHADHLHLEVGGWQTCR